MSSGCCQGKQRHQFQTSGSVLVYIHEIFFKFYKTQWKTVLFTHMPVTRMMRYGGRHHSALCGDGIVTHYTEVTRKMRCGYGFETIAQCAATRQLKLRCGVDICMVSLHHLLT